MQWKIEAAERYKKVIRDLAPLTARTEDLRDEVLYILDLHMTLVNRLPADLQYDAIVFALDLLEGLGEALERRGFPVGGEIKKAIHEIDSEVEYGKER